MHVPAGVSGFVYRVRFKDATAPATNECTRKGFGVRILGMGLRGWSPDDIVVRERLEVVNFSQDLAQPLTIVAHWTNLDGIRPQHLAI